MEEQVWEQSLKTYFEENNEDKKAIKYTKEISFFFMIQTPKDVDAK